MFWQIRKYTRSLLLYDTFYANWLEKVRHLVLGIYWQPIYHYFAGLLASEGKLFHHQTFLSHPITRSST